MVKQFIRVATGAVIASLSLSMSAPLVSAAEHSDVDADTTTADFLSRCTADEFWCGDQIVDVQINTMMAQTVNNQPHSFCLPKRPDGQALRSWQTNQGKVVVARIRQMGDSMPARAIPAIVQAMNALWPCP